MPFDAAADLQPLSVRMPSRELQLGVFHADGAWTLYSPFNRASPYPDRGQAMAAAWSQVADAQRRGWRVEFFVQDEDGALQQAAIDAP